jgi:D-aspartate ligase
VPARGALVLGGDYRALGVVRSLGRQGTCVWVAAAAEDHRLAGLSRFCRRRLPWATADDAAHAAYLSDLSRRHDLRRWVLFPTADATAAFVARQHVALSSSYLLTTPPWDVYRWAYDKRCTAELAARIGVGSPRTVPAPSRAVAESYDGDFPVVVKPATKPHLNRPAVKAWPAADHAGLLRCYDQAAAVTEPRSLMIQELVPGGSGTQFSYAALCDAGYPVAEITAERVRQYPADFGRSSSLVTTVDNHDVERLGRRVLAALGLTGLAEVEFKQDARTGSYQLLDVNVRVWGWHTIGRRFGLDLPHLAWRLAAGERLDTVRAPAGLRWLRLTTDAPVGIAAVRGGQLSARAYLRSITQPHERAVAAADDPVPGLLELPLFGWNAIRGLRSRCQGRGGEAGGRR